jgi:nitrate reductase NapE component
VTFGAGEQATLVNNMAQRIPTWAAILIAGVIIFGMLAVAAVGGTAFFIYRHINTTPTGHDAAAAEFTQARARFAGQQPLIEMSVGDEPVVHRELVKDPSGRKLETLRVLAYDRHERKLVRVSIPFWLLRLLPSNHFSFLDDNGINIDSERVNLTVDDLERRGPGLVLDTRDRRGSEVLVWTE